MTYDEAVARHNDARLSEIDAQLDILQLEAATREDSEGVTAIYELRVASESVRRLVGSLSDEDLRDLESAIAPALERYGVSARGAEVHNIRTRVDKAEARLRLWKARRAREEAELDLRRCELLFALQEQTALARAHDAEEKYDRYHRLAQDALADAARHFNEAFDAAAKRHQLPKAES